MTSLSNTAAKPIEDRYIARMPRAAPLLEGAEPLFEGTTSNLPTGVVGEISAYLAFDCADRTFSEGTLGAALQNGTIVEFYQKVVDVFAQNNQKIVMHGKARDLSDFSQFTHYVGRFSLNKFTIPIKRLLQQEPKIYDEKGYLAKPENPSEGFLENQKKIDDRLSILCGACMSIYNKFQESAFSPFLKTYSENLKPEEVDDVNKKKEQEDSFHTPFREFVFLTFKPEDFLAIAEDQDPSNSDSPSTALFNRIFEIAMRNREFFPYSIKTIAPTENLRLIPSDQMSSFRLLRWSEEEANTETIKKIKIRNYLAREAAQSPTLSSSSTTPSSTSTTSSSAANTTTAEASLTSSTASSTEANQKASEN